MVEADVAPAVGRVKRDPGAARLPVVDAVRLCSILFVLALHFVSSARITPPQPAWLEGILRLVLASGMYGVSIFFVVSGFLITRTIAERTPDLRGLDLRGFYVRRAGRILPLLLHILLGVLALRLAPHGS